MDRFRSFLDRFDIAAGVTEEDIDRTTELLRLYGPVLRRAAHGIWEMQRECYESRRQSVSDFIDLAIDYDHDGDRKRIAGRLAEMGHSMQLLSVMEDALRLMEDDTSCSRVCFDIIRTRYFNAYCRSNEDAFLMLGISSSTYYRNIRKAIRIYAAGLWYVVIPDLVLQGQSDAARESGGSRMRDPAAVK